MRVGGYIVFIMKKAFVFLILIVLVVCQAAKSRLTENIKKTIDENGGESVYCYFNMRDVTDFQWDKMVVYDPGASNDEISEALGVSFTDTTDLICGMVFVFEDAIVHNEKISFLSNHKPDRLFISLEEQEQNWKLITADNAIFRGSKSHNGSYYTYSIIPYDSVKTTP